MAVWMFSFLLALLAIALQLLPIVFSFVGGGWVHIYTHNPNGYNLQLIPNLMGKVAIVTGANSGLGKVMATELVRKGATVIMGVRSKPRGYEALKEIEAQVVDAHVEVAELDLSSFASIRAFASAFCSSGRSLHLLVLNAGVAYTAYTETVDGFEQHIGVNHLGHFLLTKLLLDQLVRSAPSRVVAITSGLHRTPYEPTGIRFETFHTPEGYNRVAAYGQSKLANILMMAELARRLQGQQVYCNAAHPGMVQTDIARYTLDDFALSRVGALLRLVFDWVVQPSLMSAQDGALTPLYVATHPDIEEQQISGKYFSPIARQVVPSRHALNTTLQKLLWERSEELTGGANAISSTL